MSYFPVLKDQNDTTEVRKALLALQQRFDALQANFASVIVSNNLTVPIINSETINNSGGLVTQSLRTTNGAKFGGDQLNANTFRTGVGVEVAYDKTVDIGQVYAYDRGTASSPTTGPKNLSLQQFGGTAMIGTTSNLGTETFHNFGFARLGNDATHPAVKIKKFTGTTGAAQGNTVTIAHGLTGGKILGVWAGVSYVANTYMPPEFTGIAGYQYSCYADTTNIVVINSAANSANILSKAIRITVLYEA